ncbi:acetoacetate decarboxylase family protein [Nocardia caishijiensis]|uniref:Acetoacetate decarboxylase n=1 Tax=Nocardia caishijiensis TaxID=184756 RepID=A0ABQ6YHG0_9NOCA|nr:acetoacetate decarboxylase family protein [Nocardia caishijiensis]KAF0845218.1 acetoacetate decarboxylase [Nocardia caishijiensis]
MSATKPTSVEVDLGGRRIEVPKGGLYDRYRMNTDLDAIARDPRVSSTDFFRRLPKKKVESPIGETLTPNFYYRMSSTRLTMLAKSRAIRSRLPDGLAPLEVVPGIGFVSVVFFRYDVCDIDFYTEVAVAVGARPARHGGPGIIDLLSGLSNDHLHNYVLSLPVSSQIAQVRGHDGYGFPKWVTEIDVDIDATGTTARVVNDQGDTDLALSAPTPSEKRYRSGERVSTLTSYTSIGGAWHATQTQINMLAGGSAGLPRGVDLQLGHGRLSEDLRFLDPIKTVRLDVITEGQVALHMPIPTSMPVG